MRSWKRKRKLFETDIPIRTGWERVQAGDTGTERISVTKHATAFRSVRTRSMRSCGTKSTEGVYIFNRAAAKDVSGRRDNHQCKNEDEVIRIEGGMPAIVSEAVFNGVANILRSRRQMSG